MHFSAVLLKYIAKKTCLLQREVGKYCYKSKFAAGISPRKLPAYYKLCRAPALFFRQTTASFLFVDTNIGAIIWDPKDAPKGISCPCHHYNFGISQF